MKIFGSNKREGVNKEDVESPPQPPTDEYVTSNNPAIDYKKFEDDAKKSSAEAAPAQTDTASVYEELSPENLAKENGDVAASAGSTAVGTEVQNVGQKEEQKV
jgi:hypothetical protein